MGSVDCTVLTTSMKSRVIQRTTAKKRKVFEDTRNPHDNETGDRESDFIDTPPARKSNVKTTPSPKKR